MTVASVSLRCNLWWLRFCPRLSRCRGQHLSPVISSGCKPESQKPTRKSLRFSMRKKKSRRECSLQAAFSFLCISSLYFSSFAAHIAGLITYNLLSKRSSTICLRIVGFTMYDHGQHCNPRVCNAGCCIPLFSRSLQHLINTK